jgi:Uma2 family endonuclease
MSVHAIIDEGERLELIDGKGHPKPRPPISHLLAATAITHAYYELRYCPRLADGWWILPDPEVFLGDSRVIPAIAGWRHERVPDPPSGFKWRETPDWVCEIHSANAQDPNRAQKRALYHSHRIPFLWDIDLDSRCIEVWQFSDEDQAYRLLSLTASDRDAVQLAPFTGLPLLLSSLWRDSGTSSSG